LTAAAIALGSLSLSTALAEPAITAPHAPHRTGQVGGQQPCQEQVCVPTYAVFSDPTTSARVAIRDDFVQAVVEGTGKQGETSHGTMRFTAYRLSDGRTAALPRRAAAYGNHVQVLLDGGVRTERCGGRADCVNPSWAALTEVNRKYHDPSRYGPGDPDTWMRTCDGIGPDNAKPKGIGAGCLGQGLNHNKFLLLSVMPDLTDGPVVRDSVRLSSSNETFNSFRNAFNDELVIQDNPAVYQDYVQYFDKLAGAYQSREPTDKQWSTGHKGNRAVTRTLATHDITTYSFPRPANQDPFPAALDAINTSDHCRVSPAGVTPVQHASVDAAIAYIKGRDDIINTLTRLRSDGCHVNVLYTTISGHDRRTLNDAGITAKPVCIEGPNLDKNPQPARLVDYLHSKYLIVHARETSLSSQPVSIVYTGSENWNDTAETHADNQDIRYVEPATNDPIYTEYLHNFELISKDVAAFPKAPAGSCGHVGH
jgi:hypothetical protein